MRLFSIGVWSVLLAGLAAPALVACGSAESREARDGEQALGSVTVKLTGTGSSGARYRLRDASFEVNGPEDVVLSSETDPDAAVIERELPAGNYLIELLDGWFLEKETAGMFAPVEAVLTSPNPIGFSIVDQDVSSVVFGFTAGDDVVDIGNGSLEVSIAVQDADCPMGQVLCGSACVDVSSDEDHCGACGNVCAPGKSCSAGVCVEVPGVFSESFEELQPSPEQCLSWNAFRASIPFAPISSVTIRGSFAMGGVTCTGFEAQMLCNALRDGSSLTTLCNGQQWSVGFCGSSVEISASSSPCGCGFGHTVRPCIGNENWGGVNTEVCGGPSQVMEVLCQ